MFLMFIKSFLSIEKIQRRFHFEFYIPDYKKYWLWYSPWPHALSRIIYTWHRGIFQFALIWKINRKLGEIRYCDFISCNKTEIIEIFCFSIAEKLVAWLRNFLFLAALVDPYESQRQKGFSKYITILTANFFPLSCEWNGCFGCYLSGKLHIITSNRGQVCSYESCVSR